MPKFLVGLVFLLLSSLLQAQNDVVYVYGFVKDDNTGLKMAEVKVSLVEDGKVVNAYTTALTGKFELDLAFDHDFELRFSKEGYVTKFIKIDSRNVPKDDKVGGFGFDVDISMIQTIEGVNFDLFKQPVGIAKYSAAVGEIAFDYEYTKAFLAKIEALKRSYQNKVKADEDKLKADQLAAEKEKQKQLKFEQALKDGDAAMGAGNFTNAIFKFSEALDIRPATKYVEEKLAAAKKALDDANTMKQKEILYKEAITAADKAFTEKNYKVAVVEYNKALNHKPTENYPKSRIKESEELLASISKQTALENQYKLAISKADSLFKVNKFETSITSYESALVLKPGEAYPQQRIGEAKAKIDELTKQKALDDRYKAAITVGDKAFTEKRFDDAILSYLEASGIKTAEVYPKTRIAEAQAKLDALAKQKSLEEQYLGFISQADKQLTAAEYKSAIGAYNQALLLKPTEVYPKTKIAEAQGKLNEISKKEAADKQYLDLISKGDQQLAAFTWQEALTSFTQASTLKPTEQYPKDKILVAKRGLDELGKQKDLEAKYKAAVTKADVAFTAKQYSQSLLAYTEARALKPSEEYPISRIAETQKILDEQAKLKAQETEYKGYLALGDSLFKATKYLEAVTYFERAQKAKPEEVYPRTRIAEANSKLDLLTRQKQLDDQYAGLIGAADKLLTASNYTDAIEEYKKASALKPAELYPKNKITEAQGKLAAISKQEAADKQYVDLLKKGDEQLGTKDWAGALYTFQQASVIKPAEVYPKEKAGQAKTELDKLAQQKAVDGQYNGLITKADLAFTAKQYDAAIKNYQQASGIKPTETYPKDKIKEAEGILAEISSQKETDKRYTGLILKADSAFRGIKYYDAISLYSQASDVKPAEVYPKNRIAEANAKLDDLGKKQALDQQYKGLIAKADGEFTAANYSQAIATYKEALALKATEVYPKTKITEAEGKLAELAKNKANNEQYASLIITADGLLASKDYPNAITKYQAASTLKPSEQYPKDKLAEAKGKLDELNKSVAAEEQYKGIIAKADLAFTASKWLESIALYEQGLRIKSGEAYPKERITEANAKIAELAKQKQEQDEAYKKAVSLGDEAFIAADYASAKSAFQQALGIRPTELYPKQKIAEADAKLSSLAKQEQLDKQYAGFITQGDNAFNSEDFNPAITSYQQASTLKPAEKYPKDKILESQAKLAALKKEKAEEDQYKSLITKADADLNSMSFDLALKGYQQALALRPEEQYPKDRIEICNLRIAELMAVKLRDQNYKTAVAIGDSVFKSKDYNGAIANYEDALDIKANEQYPQERIKLANAEIANLSKAKETNEKYLALIVVADTTFNKEKWTESIATYKEALNLKPTEIYPTTKIKAAEAKLAEIERSRLLREAKYTGLIQKADSAFNKATYQVAKNFYAEAIRVKPTEQYPKDRMAEADAKLDELARQEADDKAANELKKLNEPVTPEKVDPTIVSFKDVTSFGDIKKDTVKTAVVEPKPALNAPKVMYRTTTNGDLDEFRRKLGESYPEGKTEETFSEGSKKISRTIYVKDKLGDEFLKVVFTNGMGTFYFKNGDTAGLSAVEYDKMIKELK